MRTLLAIVAGIALLIGACNVVALVAAVSAPLALIVSFVVLPLTVGITERIGR